MKKLLLVLAFAFIGQQAFSQMYIVVLSDWDSYPSAGCVQGEGVVLKIDPTGAETASCIGTTVSNGYLSQINQEFNNLISQGYKMMNPNPVTVQDGGTDLYVDLYNGATRVWFFAIP